MFAIVAIPNQDDYVWRISSEKIPHLTLVAFEDPGWTPESLALVTGYIEHAASLMTRFGLDVDRRGELGDKKADVLFFTDRWNFGKVKQFRSNLLANTLVNAAVRSADQFPDWIPHLTLGFPATPAKKDVRDYPGTNWVNFDQIALWTGDFSGPTFRLKSEDAFLEDVAMSQSQAAADVVAGMLKHFGVKGMKWGVHRSQGGSGGAPQKVTLDVVGKKLVVKGGQGRLPSDDFARAALAKRIVKKSGSRALSNKELQDLVTRMNLEQQFKKLSPPSKRQKAGKFVAEIVVNVGKQQVTKIASDVASKQVASMLAKTVK